MLWVFAPGDGDSRTYGTLWTSYMVCGKREKDQGDC